MNCLLIFLSTWELIDCKNIIPMYLKNIEKGQPQNRKNGNLTRFLSSLMSRLPFIDFYHQLLLWIKLFQQNCFDRSYPIFSFIQLLSFDQLIAISIFVKASRPVVFRRNIHQPMIFAAEGDGSKAASYFWDSQSDILSAAQTHQKVFGLGLVVSYLV